MEQAIILYAKFILTVIGFTVPLVIFLISYFRQGSELLKRKSKEKYDMETILMKLEVSRGNDNMGDYLDEVKKKFKKIEKELRKNQNLTNPKRQIARLSLSFLSSFLFVLTYFVTYYFKQPYIAYTFLIISIGCFLYGINVVKQLFYTIIAIREAENLEISLTKTKENDPTT